MTKRARHNASVNNRTLPRTNTPTGITGTTGHTSGLTDNNMTGRTDKMPFSLERELLDTLSIWIMFLLAMGTVIALFGGFLAIIKGGGSTRQ